MYELVRGLCWRFRTVPKLWFDGGRSAKREGMRIMGEKPPNNPETRPETRFEYPPKPQKQVDPRTAAAIGDTAIKGGRPK